MFNFLKSKPSRKPLEISDSNFNDLIFNFNGPVLLDFKASWCQPCHVMISLINRLAKEDDLENIVRIGVADIDMSPALAKHFQIRSVPTLLFIKNKKVIERQNGLTPYPLLKEKVMTFAMHYSSNN